jgi:hypothetical protein
MKRPLLRVALLAALGLGVSASMAYVLSGNRWRDGKTTLYTGFPASLANATLFSSALEESMALWNTTPFRFQIDGSYVDPCSGYSRSNNGSGFPIGNGDGKNSVDFRSDVCGNDFDSSTLAITLNMGTKGSLGFDYIDESDIIFNTRYDWAVYDGTRRLKTDFRRVALHELGHVLGLGHEATNDAIMAPKLGDLDRLTADDKAGAALLYGPPQTCPVRALALNSQRRDSLGGDDCSIRQLYGYGNDTSLVDTWRLELQQETNVRVRMASTALDSVILITDEQLNPVEIIDDSNGGCDVDAQVRLPAGRYLLLANTFVNPEKCGGNTGSYTLTVSDSPYPFLGNTGNTRSGGSLAAASFSGWARLDGGTTARSSFAANDPITVEGRIDPDPDHIGKAAGLYVLVVISNGQQLMMTQGGRFEPFLGLGLAKPLEERVLQGREVLPLASGLRGSTTGLTGLGFQVFLGYALLEAPQDIHFGGSPIAFSIAR